MEERNYIHQLKAENATLKNNKKAADMTISELRKKLSKTEHDRDRYRKRIDTLENQVAEAERRAEVYYEALLSAAAYGDTPPDYYIEQAERELAEEGKEW